jgi:integrase
VAQVTRIPAHEASIDDVLAAVVACWRESSELSEQSTGRMQELADRFVGFARRGHGCETLADVDTGVVAGFVSAVGTTGPPAAATQHLRRSAVRLLFRTARQLGLVDGDPTLDLVLAPRSNLRARPLDDIEIEVCRSYAQSTLTETRLPAAWALAEATARTSELPHLRICDIDLDAGRVWIWGSPRCEPRWGALSNWGVLQLERRINSFGTGDPHRRLIYSGRGDPVSAQASSCTAIAKVLTLAGLGTEPDIRPMSVIGWAGNKVLETTDRIEAVAIALGVRSLDRAAGLIAWNWTGTP